MGPTGTERRLQHHSGPASVCRHGRNKKEVVATASAFAAKRRYVHDECDCKGMQRKLDPGLSEDEKTDLFSAIKQYKLGLICALATSYFNNWREHAVSLSQVLRALVVIHRHRRSP